MYETTQGKIAVFAESKTMNRNEATKFCRTKLDEHGLSTWRIRLATELKANSFLGKCSYKDKTIYLNTHHIDTHPEAEVKNTILHEIAHALCINQGHNEIWAAKARAIGCDNTMPCATYGLNANAIDAIRSGAMLEVEVTEETQVIRTPKYTVTRFQDKCDVCGKVAKERSSKEFRTKSGVLNRIVTFECGHIRIIKTDSQSPFETIVSNDWLPEVASCKHVWNKNTCETCREYRLFPFQVEGARFLEKQNGRAAIFDEMRLGKTVQALAYLKYHPEAFPALFVVKSAIKYQWMKEIIRWLGEKYFPQVISDSKQGVLPGLKCYITSYDLLRRFDRSKLESLHINTVVLDEVQAIKNPDATRTQEVRKICKEIGHLIPLSGTPWKNRGSEFFVVLNMLDPVKFWSYESFKKQWVATYYDGSREKEGGIRNPDKFKEHIKDLAIRRERTEVAPEMPIVVRTRLHCKLEDDARKTYENEVSDFVKWYNSEVVGGNEDSKETNQKAIARLQRMRHILGLAKIPVTVDYVEDFLEETENKLIVFVQHIDVGELLFKMITDVASQYNVKVFKMNASADKFAIQEEFNSLKRGIIVASTLASGEGLTLPGADIIMHERQWNPMNEEQAESRAVFITGKDSINATYVHADQIGSVDIHLDKIVEAKRHQFHAVMNKGMAPVWNETNLIKELTESIVAEASKK